jgi:2-dehydropantoate 2-reductase
VRIAVVGTGAMGSVYAGLLAEGGNDVWAIDPQVDHIDAIRAFGLRVSGASGDRVVPVHAATDASVVGPVDLVVIATKAHDVHAAAAGALSLVGPATIVLPIQNGLGSVDVVAEVCGPTNVIVGVVGGWGASLPAPGHVHHHGSGSLRLGERSGPVTPRVEEIADVWRAAGVVVHTYDDVDQLVWEKLICNVAFSGPCAILGCTIGEILDDASAWQIASNCVREAYEVAIASGIDLRIGDPVQYVAEFGAKIPGARPSLLLDVLAGRRCEIDAINGAIAPRARELGLHAHYNEAVSELVRAGERLRLGAERAPLVASESF